MIYFFDCVILSDEKYIPSRLEIWHFCWTMMFFPKLYHLMQWYYAALHYAMTWCAMTFYNMQWHFSMSFSLQYSKTIPFMLEVFFAWNWKNRQNEIKKSQYQTENMGGAQVVDLTGVAQCGTILSKQDDKRAEGGAKSTFILDWSG